MSVALSDLALAWLPRTESNQKLACTKAWHHPVSMELEIQMFYSIVVTCSMNS
jgi:hypothetical protein